MEKLLFIFLFAIIGIASQAQDTKQHGAIYAEKGVSHLYITVNYGTDVFILKEIYLQDFGEKEPTKLNILETIQKQDEGDKYKVQHPKTKKIYLFTNIMGMSFDAVLEDGTTMMWMPTTEFVLGTETLVCNSGPFFSPFLYRASPTAPLKELELVEDIKQNDDNMNILIFKLKFPVAGVCTVKLQYLDKEDQSLPIATATIITPKKVVRVLKQKKYDF